MSATDPKVFTINVEHAFVDELAHGIVDRYGSDPLSLSGVTVLLPNRRAVRALREAFLRRHGHQPLLLPTMRAIGDIDEGEIEVLSAGFGIDFAELVPPISPLRRQILLSQLVERWQLPLGDRTTLAPAQAWRLAEELASLVDQVDTAGLSFDRLEDLAPENLALHWHDTLEFLKIATVHWPEILLAEGKQDPAAYRNQSLRQLSGIYQKIPPEKPVIAAGSTGSIPATAELLKTISRLPHGSVVLPAFDASLSDEAWDALDETHPQSSMKRLLNAMGVSRFEVDDWISGTGPKNGTLSVRNHMLRMALLPAVETEKWRIAGFADMQAAEIFKGLKSVVATSRREEAAAIAVAMRETLEIPEKTAALVTPDRQLALHVRAALAKWGILIDDSGGDRALNSLPGRLLALLAVAASDHFGPLSFLSVLQHPMVCAKLSRPEFLSMVREVDRHVMRGVRPVGGLQGLVARAETVGKEKNSPLGANTLKHFKRVVSMLVPLEKSLQEPATLTDTLKVHLGVAEDLCTDGSQTGAERLWRGEAGIALSNHLAELLESAQGLAVPSAESYDAFFTEVMTSATVRPGWNKHPRLAIWGPLEARLQRADLMILGGLNEGVWPTELKVDPWMSGAMRAEFGLPPLERRIGQSAHDFLVAAGGGEVLLTRAEKTDGTPTVPSRWWLRVEALAGRAVPRASNYLHWASQMDTPESVQPLAAPKPRPPLEARPTQLSVTQIQEWMRDPYALYAKKILGLTTLDPIDDKPNAAQKGILLHEALELFMKEPGKKTGKEGLVRLMEAGERAFEPVITQPAVYAFWWPRFQRIASWFVENETDREIGYEPVLIEGWAKYTVRFTPDVPAFTLVAKADRIDRNKTTGQLAIIDYKTGETPTAKQVEAGYAPQLPLEAWLAKAGAFEKLAATETEDLVYWKLSGGSPVQEQKRPIKDISSAVEEAEAGLRRLVVTFGDPKTAYLSNPRPTITGYGDYDHLSRVKEWRNSLAPVFELANSPKDET